MPHRRSELPHRVYYEVSHRIKDSSFRVGGVCRERTKRQAGSLR